MSSSFNYFSTTIRSIFDTVSTETFETDTVPTLGMYNCILHATYTPDVTKVHGVRIGVNNGGTRGTRPPRNHSTGDANVIRHPQILTT